MSRKNVEDIYPLSPLQEGMLFHAVYSQGEAYSEQFPMLVQGTVDAAALERAFRQVVARHPALRTSFVWENVPQPLQVVHREVEPAVEHHDWTSVGEGEWMDRLEGLLGEDRRRGHDLRRAPLARMILIRLSGERLVLVLSIHHTVIDGWSLPVVMEEMDAFYRAALAGRDAVLPPAPRYREYLAWLQRRDAAASQAFWTEEMRGFTQPTPLPLITGAPGDTEEQGIHVLEAPAGFARRLQAFARERTITPGTLLQAAFAVVLARHSGESDVVFGTTVSGRPADLPGVERMVGAFINTIPVRVHVPSAATVGEWLAEVQHRQSQAREHEHARLIDIQGWSEVPREVPLFGSLFVVENYPYEEDSDEVLRVHMLPARERTNYPLVVVGIPGDDELLIRVSYDERRYTADAARLIAERMAAVLDELISGADRPLAEVRGVTAEDREWMRSAAAGPEAEGAGMLVHELFEARAAESPESTAVIFQGEEVSFGELNARANRIAARLRALGASPDSVVGVCLERTPDLIATLIGVLKAGAAYVALDPAYPRDRVQLMLADSGARVLVTERELAGRFSGDAVSALLLDELEGDSSPVANPPRAADADGLAWVIYTSGSTGRPKGVGTTHRGAVAFLHWARGRYAPEPGGRVLASTSVSFDVHVAEIHFALAWGHPLVLVDSALALLEPGAAAGAVLASMPPTPAAELLRAGAIPSSVRRLNLGGEPVPPALARELYERTSVEVVGNAYGPTEETVYSTYSEIPRGADRVLIGRPVAGTLAWIADPADLRPLPPGAPGELCLGGVKLARGYLGRPALTAERFVPDPFAGVPGARMYRTGDRVRWTPDAQLDYLERADFQVKVRGFRVEPGEVEFALLEHPGVAMAAVAARPGADGVPALVAWIVAADAVDVDAAALRQHLSARLPDYMVPAAFVPVGDLPRTPSGKVDRRALPDPDAAAREAEYVEPSTETERTLAAVWSELLSVDRVGAADSFFAIGGHSLLAMQLATRVQAQFGVELPLRDMFEAARLDQMAARIDALRDPELDALLAEMEALSDADAAALLARADGGAA